MSPSLDDGHGRPAGAGPQPLPRPATGMPDPAAARRRTARRELPAGGLHRAAGQLGVPVRALVVAAHLRVLGSLTSCPTVATALATPAVSEPGEAPRPMPLRVDLADLTWAELAAEVLRAEGEAAGWSGVPDRRIPASVHAAADSRLTVAERQQPPERQVADGLAAGPFALLVDVTVLPGGRTLVLDVSCDDRLVHPAVAARMPEYYRCALASVAAEPSAVAARAEIRPRAEREAVAAAQSGPALPVPGLPSLYAAFRRQAAARPDQPAVHDVAESVTYRQLEERVGLLAQRLRAAGVGRGDRVGVSIRRGVDLVAGLFAVLATGAAYVPLDPEFPESRLEFIAQDAGLACLLAGPGVTPPAAGVPVLPLAGPPPAEAASPSPSLSPPEVEAEVEVSGADCAYVIYTSGSTGRPKGTVVEQRNVAAFLAGMDHAIGITPEDRVLALTSVSFDISVLETLWPLTRGAGVVVCPERMVERLSAGRDALADLVRRFRPTLLQATPSFFLALTSHPATLRSLAGLRTLLVGGETLPRGLATQLLDALAGVRIHNMYGPTETTVWSLTHELGREDDRSLPVPIGRPIAHTRTRVVDGLGNEACLAVPGELWIGGAGVARGYSRRPDLDAERFVRSADGDGVRYYRTGDRVRRQEDGTLEFLGRDDRQVKIRGHRIELDEVESVLSEHPRVGAAAVAVSRHPERGAELVAYVRPGRAADLAAAQAAELRGEVRQFVKDRLGTAAAPAQVVLAAALPLLPNGKTDHSRLHELSRVPAAPGDTAGGSFAAGDAPEFIRDVWRDVLGTDRIGAESDFFDLGGTSLTAVRMAARWVAAGGPPFDLVQFLREPTVRHLAELTGGRPPAPVAEWAGPGPATPHELARLAELPADLHPARPGAAPRAAGRAVLVTAVRDQLGGRLVRELLDRGDAPVHVLVDAADAGQASARLTEDLTAWGAWRDGDAERLTAIPGDLPRPRLGLDPAAYRRLQQDVAAIVHPAICFARRAGWEEAAAVHVHGTQEALRLAVSGAVKPVHFLAPLDPAAVSADQDPPQGGAVGAAQVAGALRQTQWVAEQRLRQAAARGIPVVTHGFGQLVGTAGTGLRVHDVFLSALVRTCISLRAAPELDLSFPVTPLELLAQDVADAVLERGQGSGPAAAVTGLPVTWQEIVSDIRFSGRAVEVLPYARWRQLLLDSVERAEIHDLTPYLPLVGSDGLSPALGYQAVWDLPQPAEGSALRAAADTGGRDLLRTYPSRFDAIGSATGGIVVREHTVTVPLDHARPHGESISVYAQEVVSAEHEHDDLPWMLFLQGGPGAPCPRPAGPAGWLGAALKGHRVLLLDQRGGGRSAPITAATMAGRTASQAADYIRHFRADSIVADAEILRQQIAGGRPWKLLGQSYGGFIALAYLSAAPDGLTSVVVSGGLPGLTEPVDEVYAHMYEELLRKNAAYYAEYPGDVERIRALADHLDKNDVRLPDGDRLTVGRMRLLGRNLGMSFGFERVHQLFGQAWDGEQVSEVFRRAVAAETGYADMQLYALQEFVYARSGMSTAWAADRVQARFPDFQAASGPLLLFGELMFPWMFQEISQLTLFAQTAELLADATDFPDLYDLDRLADNTVPVAAVVYEHDLYTPVEIQLRTAAAVANTRVLRTDEFHHNGLMRSASLTARLLAMTERDEQ